MDSFYTTNNLVNDLFKKQVYVIGAVRSNSSAMPAVGENVSLLPSHHY
jgi:hypothetical protein